MNDLYDVTEADEVAAAAEAGFPAMLEHLEAVSLGDDRYAWMASQQGPWVTATAEQMKTCYWKQPAWAQGERWLEWPDGGNASVTMPSWWSPEQRFVWRSGCQVTFDAAGPSVKQWDRGGPPWVLYSADLETGAEVPA